MTFFLLWNTKEDILKNVLYVHIIKVSGVKKINEKSKYFLCSPEFYTGLKKKHDIE